MVMSIKKSASRGRQLVSKGIGCMLGNGISDLFLGSSALPPVALKSLNLDSITLVSAMLADLV